MLETVIFLMTNLANGTTESYSMTKDFQDRNNIATDMVPMSIYPDSLFSYSYNYVWWLHPLRSCWRQSFSWTQIWQMGPRNHTRWPKTSRTGINGTSTFLGQYTRILIFDCYPHFWHIKWMFHLSFKYTGQHDYGRDISLIIRQKSIYSGLEQRSNNKCSHGNTESCIASL